MATWQDVRRCATSLPGVVEGTSYGRPAWEVRKKTFAWERPLGRKDLADLGLTEQAGEGLGVRVADDGVAQALVASSPACFTIPHFRGFTAVLVQLADVEHAELEELVVEAWLCRAPTRLVADWLASPASDA